MLCMGDPSLDTACVHVYIFNSKSAGLQLRENLLENLHKVARGDF